MLTRSSKTVLCCVGGALVAYTVWFQAGNLQRRNEGVSRARQFDAESSRQLSIEEMDSYANRSSDLQRTHLRIHDGEALVDGLRVGMSKQEVGQILPNGLEEKSAIDVMRYPHPRDKSLEVLARFLEGRLLFAKDVVAGDKAAGFDLNVRYGEPREYGQGQ